MLVKKLPVAIARSSIIRLFYSAALAIKDTTATNIKAA